MIRHQVVYIEERSDTMDLIKFVEHRMLQLEGQRILVSRGPFLEQWGEAWDAAIA